MSNTPRVWIVQDTNNDYSSAEDFGEVRFITKTDYTSIMDSSANRAVAFDIKKFKSEYLPGVDYIAPGGNPMTTALVVMSLISCPHRFLKWDGRKGAYIPHILNPNEVL